MPQGSVIIPSDLWRLRPLKNTQINQARQTGYCVISHPCYSERLCQKYMVTDPHKQILIMITTRLSRSCQVLCPEGSNYSPNWFQQKPNHEDMICVGVSHHWPAHISHTSSQHLTGLPFIKSRWVICRVWLVVVAWQHRLGSNCAWFGHTFTHSNCCFCQYQLCLSLENNADKMEFICSKAAVLWNANDKENRNKNRKGIVIRPVQMGGQKVVESWRQILIFTALSLW